jgi:hypothetical protein
MIPLQVTLWAAQGYLQAECERADNGPRWRAVKSLYRMRRAWPRILAWLAHRLLLAR